MNLFKVPFKCQCCKRTGLYLTAIDFDSVQLQCKCGSGAVQTQMPLAILEHYRADSNTFEERYEDVRIRKGRKVA